MKLVFGILSVLGVIGAGVALFTLILDLKTDTAPTKREVRAVSERLARVEKELEASRATQTQSMDVLARIESQLVRQQPLPLGTAGTLQFGVDEAEIIRNFILNQPNVGPDMSVIAKIGETVRNVPGRQVPVELVSRLPKLRGLQYVLDSSWAIALIAGTTNRVVAVIPPI